MREVKIKSWWNSAHPTPHTYEGTGEVACETSVADNLLLTHLGYGSITLLLNLYSAVTAFTTQMPMPGYDDTTPDTTEIYTFFGGQPGFKLYNSTMFSTPKNSSTQASVSYSTVIVQGPKSKSTTPSPSSLRDDNDKYLLANSERPNDKFCQDCKEDNEIRDESNRENIKNDEIKAPWPFTVPR